MSLERRLRANCAASLAVCAAASLAAGTSTFGLEVPSFTHHVVAAQNGRVGIGDLDGDGRNDIVHNEWGTGRGDSADGTLKWYRFSDWQRFDIETGDTLFGDEIIVRDFDNDGDLDVACTRKTPAAELLYVNNGNGQSWTKKVAFAVNYGEDKGQNAADFDGDGLLDIAWRNTTRLYIAYQDNVDAWQVEYWAIDNRENLAVGDVDNDGRPDVILNGFWYRNPGGRPTSAWTRYIFASKFFGNADSELNAIKIEVGDVNGDGKNDIVVSMSEGGPTGIVWYSADDPLSSNWTEHVIDATASGDYRVIDRKMHTLQVEDLNGDGFLDVVAGGIDNVPWFYLNTDGTGLNWQKEIIGGPGGSYSGIVGDVGSDGSRDIVTSQSWDDADWTTSELHYWENSIQVHDALSLTNWARHLIDDASGRSPFVATDDMDGDGDLDIVMNRSWYENPGAPAGTWTKHAIFPTWQFWFAATYDFDDDGDIDVLGTFAQNDNHFKWAENDGDGNFTIHENFQYLAGGDFLQGIAVGDFQGTGVKVYLSWHNGANGLEVLSVPADPVNQTWTWEVATSTETQEEIDPGDIDGDGDIDLLMGRRWAENTGTGWTGHELAPRTEFSPAAPDRCALQDIDGDGDLDAVITLEYGTAVLWAENPRPGGSVTGYWTVRTIGDSPGQGFSMDSRDIDQDGDPDIVVGEHKGDPENKVYIFENDGSASWPRHEIDSQPKAEMDHHDGTNLVDIDGDGDLDIVSISWDAEKVYLYENTNTSGVPGPAGNPSPADQATGVGTDVDLSWSPGRMALSHDVYFGRNPSPDSAEFQGNQTATTFDPGALDFSTTYYWRIDEHHASGMVAGAVWRFTTRGLPGPGTGEITVSGSGSATAGAAGQQAASFTASHSGGPNNYLVVAAVAETSQITGMNFGGQPMTLLLSEVSTSGKVQFFGLATEAVSGPVDATYSGNISGPQVFGYVFLQGVDPAAPLRTSAGASQDTGTGAITLNYPVPVEAGDCAVLAAYKNDERNIAVSPNDEVLIDTFTTATFTGLAAYDAALAGGTYASAFDFDNDTKREVAGGIVLAAEEADPNADSDGDGIPDWYEAYYGGSVTGLVATADSDGDGADAFAEWIAFTDPGDSNSYFHVGSMTGLPASPMVLQWASATGRVYHVCWSASLWDAMTRTATNLPATPPMNAYTDTVHGAEIRGFYCLEVGLE